MTINRNFSLFAEKVSSAGLLNPSGGGLGTSATPANGQIPIGNATNFTLSTLTAGQNIVITNTSGAITVATTASTLIIAP
jgi:hypothetical protein